MKKKRKQSRNRWSRMERITFAMFVLEVIRYITDLIKNY